MKQIAQWISDTIRIRNNVSGIREIRNEVKKMCKKFPVP